MMQLERRQSGLFVARDPEPPKPPEPTPRPPRITACPDCGGSTENGWEHESRYTIVCRACCKGFAFATGTWIVSPDDCEVNRFKRSWPIPDPVEREYDPMHDAKCKVTVLDTVSGKTTQCDTENAWQWMESNWSCDCNRGELFDLTPEEWPGDDSEHCQGARFLVTAVEFPPDLTEYTLADMNSCYPSELLERFGLPLPDGPRIPSRGS